MNFRLLVTLVWQPRITIVEMFGGSLPKLFGRSLKNHSNTGVANLRRESVGFGEGVNFFLPFQTFDLLGGPNPFQFALKNHA
jgi:hypothetical protein